MPNGTQGEAYYLDTPVQLAQGSSWINWPSVIATTSARLPATHRRGTKFIVLRPWGRGNLEARTPPKACGAPGPHPLTPFPAATQRVPGPLPIAAAGEGAHGVGYKTLTRIQ